MLVRNEYNFMETQGWLGQRWGRNLRLILKGCISLKGMLYFGLTGGQLESMAVGVGLRNAERLYPFKKLIKRGGTSTECEREPYKKEKTPSNKQCITKRKRWQQAVENSHRVPHHHAMDFSQDALHTHTHTSQIVTIVFKCSTNEPSQNDLLEIVHTYVHWGKHLWQSTTARKIWPSPLELYVTGND